MSVEFLKSLGIKPHYFGLGFIQLKLDDTWRLHFWVPAWPTIPGAEHEFHDHRYDFTSTVIKGQLRHEVIAAGPLRSKPRPFDMERIEVSCKPGETETPKVMGYCETHIMANFQVNAGDTYVLGTNAFHKSFAYQKTITLVQRGDMRKEMAAVLREQGTSFTCPFSIDKNEEECWQKINELLSVENNPPELSASQQHFIPGYHLRPIKKGQLGETSKIQEELDELVEAMEQDVKIMAAVELADLYGAIEAYLENHFPHLKMEDLARMSDTTKRAFLNGRRT